jgi:4-diphosphocytidyl-2-C-methyl-D-erythritol kinase
LKFTHKHLKFIALNIGSDIPFFLSGYTKAWVSDLGNKVTKTNDKVPGFRVILTNIPMNTTKVYNKMNTHYRSQVLTDKAYRALNTTPFYRQTFYNDMWLYANKINPQLSALSHKLLKTKNIILSGSGGSFIEIK